MARRLAAGFASRSLELTGGDVQSNIVNCFVDEAPAITRGLGERGVLALAKGRRIRFVTHAQDALRTRPAMRVSGRVRLGAIATVQTGDLPRALRLVRGLAERGVDVRAGTANQFDAFLAKERAKWWVAVKESGATVD